jgi:hypothetical protein
LASHLNKVEEILLLNNIKEKDVVISVPGYLTIDERKAIMAAG